jgi:hypothetical protein
VKQAKDNGLDAGVTRTAETASPTTFEQWCARTSSPPSCPDDILQTHHRHPSVGCSGLE